MSKDEFYCHDKRIYNKKGALTARNRRYSEDHVALRIYPCSDCGGWHLTSNKVYRKNSSLGFHKQKKPQNSKWKYKSQKKYKISIYR